MNYFFFRKKMNAIIEMVQEIANATTALLATTSEKNLQKECLNSLFTLLDELKDLAKIPKIVITKQDNSLFGNLLLQVEKEVVNSLLRFIEILKNLVTKKEFNGSVDQLFPILS